MFSFCLFFLLVTFFSPLRYFPLTFSVPPSASLSLSSFASSCCFPPPVWLFTHSVFSLLPPFSSSPHLSSFPLFYRISPHYVLFSIISQYIPLPWFPTLSSHLSFPPLLFFSASYSFLPQFFSLLTFTSMSSLHVSVSLPYALALLASLLSSHPSSPSFMSRCYIIV